MARGLHHGRARRAVSAHEERDADHALVTHSRGLGRCAGLHDVVQRDDGAGGEEGVLHLRAGFVKDIAQRHLDQLEARGQAREFGLGQGGEQMVLARIVGRCHGEGASSRAISSARALHADAAAPSLSHEKDNNSLCTQFLERSGW